MSDGTNGDFARTGLPYADRVRAVRTDEPFRRLANGWRDFCTTPWVSLAIGLIVVVTGLVLTVGLVLAGYFYLTAPLIVGFMLVGPALTVASYAVSREVEAGRRPTLSGALAA